MRLFYIIIFLLSSVSFAGKASRGKIDADHKNSLEISFIPGKKKIKFLSDYGQDNESLQKDFLSSTIAKSCCHVFLLLIALSGNFLEKSISNIKAEIKRLRLNYCSLFKKLYPKHVFW